MSDERAKTMVFRVTGIPLTATAEELEEAFLSEFGGRIILNAKKITMLPSCYSDNTQTALIQFRPKPPAKLLTALLTYTTYDMEFGDEDISIGTNFFGLTQLYPTKGDIKADIVAVTGLNGHAYESWRGRGNLGRMWLRDFLSKDLPDCRTMVYGFNCKLGAGGTHTILDYAGKFLEELMKARKSDKEKERPLVLIGHSFGGIIIAQSLVRAKENEDIYGPLFACTRALIFFGTPHRGLPVDDILAMLGQDSPRNELVLSLKRDSENLKPDLERFINCCGKLNIVSFNEANQTQKLVRGPDGYFSRTGQDFTAIERESLVLPLPNSIERVHIVKGDHSEIVKFENKRHQSYISVVKHLKDFMLAWDEEPHIPNIAFDIPFELDYPRNLKFTGREYLLQYLNIRIRDAGRTSNVTVLYGTGGMGKTQVALEYVYRYREEYSSVFWVNSASEETTVVGFRSIAQRLIDHHATLTAKSKPDYIYAAQVLGLAGIVEDGQLSVKKEDTKRIVTAVKQWYCLEENMNWLLVLDNVENLKSFDINSFIPISSHGTVLVTSRRQCWPHRTTLEVVEMLGAEGALLLLRSAGLHTTQLDTEGKYSPDIREKIITNRLPCIGNDLAVELARKLGCLPLAIDQAGAYIAARQMPLKRYADTYEKTFSKVFGEKPTVWSYRDQTVFTTWEISFQAIEDESKEAAELLLLCSFLSNEDIWEEMLRLGMEWEEDDLTLEDSLKLLFSYSLAHHKGLTNSFYIHPLVHLWACERLSPEERAQKTRDATSLIGTALGCFADRSCDQRTHEARFLIHMDVVVGNIKKYTKTRMKDITEMSFFDSIAWLAGTLWHHGHLKEAEELELQVLEASVRVLGRDHSDTLATMSNLASAYSDQGRLKEAEELELQVLEVEMRVLGKDHPDTLTTMSNLAWTYSDQGRLKEAGEMKLQALEARVRVLGKDHPATLKTMGNLASVYSDQGRWKEAEELELQVLEASVRVLGKDHPDTLIAMSDLASTYSSQGRLKEAEELELQVLETMVEVLGKDHPNTLETMNNLVSTYLDQERLKEAEELGLQVLEARMRVLGKDHPDTLTTMNNLASTYLDQGRLKEAEKLGLKVLGAKVRVLGKDHPDTLTTMSSLAWTYSDQGRLKEAEELELQVVEASVRVLGKDHPDTLIAMSSLASTYSSQGRLKEAEELELEVTKANKTLGLTTVEPL